MSDNLLNPFVKLAGIDVSQHIEKKSNLSYLSWAWAVDQLMRADPAANWEFHEPTMYGQTMMVSCTVTAFGKPITMHLPVMDHKNKAVPNPDAFVVNKNMMRCLVKAIACHGLGLYIYAGEDLPADEEGNVQRPQRQSSRQQTRLAPPAPAPQAVDISAWLDSMDAAKDRKTLASVAESAWNATQDDRITEHFNMLKLKFTSPKEQAA